MAQTGYTPILIYSSSTTTNAPAAGNLTNSTLGSELAINITDGKLFYKDNSNNVQVIAWKTTPTTAGGTGLTSYTAGDLLYFASGTALSKLGIGTNGQILKSTGTAPAWETVSNLAVTSISFGTTGLTPSTATQGAVTVAGTLVAANGGTGQSSYAVGDILYASTSTALSKLADVATGNALISGGVGVAPAWGKIGLTTHVSGTLPVGNGGTGITTTPTNGQIPIGNGTNYVAATLTAGSGIGITNASGAVTIANNTGPAFSAYMGAGQALTGAANAKLIFDTEVFDTANCYDPTTNYRFTPNVAGYYQISAGYYGAQPQVGDYAVNIYKNGAAYGGAGFGGGNAGSGGYVQKPAISMLIYLNGTTDYVEIYAYVGVTQTTVAGAASSFFCGALVRGA